MLERILSWDEEAFLVVNRDWVHPVLDWLLIPARNPLTWLPVYVFLLLFLILNFNKQGFKMIGLVVLCFILTDQLSGHVIKPLLVRVRPCNDAYLSEYVRQLVPCGSGYSFTSNHASNHFGISMILLLMMRKIRWWIGPLLVLWAALVAYAQVYVGLHYPLDVMGGAVLGTLTAFIVFFSLRKRLTLSAS